MSTHQAQLYGAIRALLAVLAGYLSAKVDSVLLDALAAAAVSLIIWWSARSKSHSKKSSK